MIIMPSYLKKKKNQHLIGVQPAALPLRQSQFKLRHSHRLIYFNNLFLVTSLHG